MTKRVSFTVLSIMLLAALFLTACNSKQVENKTLKIGVSIPAGSNNTVKTWYDAIKAKGKTYGMEVIGIDAQVNPSKQVSDIDSLLTQGVDAIIIWPLDAGALKPAIDRVNAKKIPVLGADFNVNKGGPDYSLTNQVILGREEAAVKAAGLFAKTFPNGAEVAGIGMAIPVPGNIFVMKKFKSETEKYKNLNWVGQQDNPTDNISGAEPLMANLLTKYPKLQAIFTYNDESAIGAAQAILNANKKLYSKESPDGIMIIGCNAEESGIEAIKQGKEFATFNLNPVKAGVASVDFIHQLLDEKKDLTTLSKEIVIPLPMINGDNLEQFISWKDEIASIK